MSKSTSEWIALFVLSLGPASNPFVLTFLVIVKRWLSKWNTQKMHTQSRS
jgi:hypothetical protein